CPRRIGVAACASRRPRTSGAPDRIRLGSRACIAASDRTTRLRDPHRDWERAPAPKPGHPRGSPADKERPLADVHEVSRAIGNDGLRAQGRALAEWSADRLSPARRSESEARQPAWLGVDLRHLVAFRAISETGSFVKAARSLGYTQPAISHQVATLERIVGHRLFERSSGPGTAELTAAGNAFAGHAAAAIANLDCARAELNALDARERGTLRVGSFQSVSAPILPRVVGNIRLERRPLPFHLTRRPNHE